MYRIQCKSCLASAYAEDGSNPDAAVVCTSPADDPPGSPEGSCCTVHESHEHHAAEVARTMDATCRPIVIEVMPGSVTVAPAIA